MRGFRALTAVVVLLGSLSGLDGLHAEPSASERPKTRIWANSRTAWIYPTPRLQPNGVGYIRSGASVQLKTGQAVKGAGCKQGWYEVEPAGFVCADQRTAFEPTRYVRSMQHVQPSSKPLPFNYALSNHAPMYRRLPSPEEWQQHERYLGAPGTFGPLSWGNRGHEKLAEVRDVPASSSRPVFFQNGGSVSRSQARQVLRRMIPLGSMLAYTSSFEHAGRTWLFSADGTLVPADRVRPFRESKFRGVQLGQHRRLPLAWIKSEAQARYVQTAEGTFEPVVERWQVREPVSLATSEPVRAQGHSYYRSTSHDSHGRALFVRDTGMSLLTAREKLPWGIEADEKWMAVSITRGTLVAYRGLTPVFATLISPGAGGVPVKGRDHVKWSTTPLGRFRITFKHLAADMSPEKGEQRKFWIADVPYTQYFSPPFALHVAYWHENFGDPMSAGCVNLSPQDGKWLFEWTGPRLPDGWNGIAPSAFSGRGTVLIISR